MNCPTALFFWRIDKVQKRIISIILFSFFVVSLPLAALDVPKLKGQVNDYANVLSSSEERQIEEVLAGLEQSTSAQAAVLTIPSLEGDALESFSIRTVDEWTLGQAGEDNGVLILLALAEKKVRIEVGYGLEGSLTDAKSGYIIREIMVPYFQKGDYAGGLYASAKAVSGVITADADISSEQIAGTSGSSSRSRRGVLPFNFLFGVMFVIFALLRGFGRAFGRRSYRRTGGMGGLGSALFWGSVLGSASRRNNRRGGFGGGGFGGFSGGGGGFGGGGASGGW